jgi:hypothetical protein
MNLPYEIENFMLTSVILKKRQGKNYLFCSAGNMISGEIHRLTIRHCQQTSRNGNFDIDEFATGGILV